MKAAIRSQVILLKATDPQAYARLLELEYRCERCHRREGAELFDRLFVCSPCRRVLERKLVRDG